MTNTSDPDWGAEAVHAFGRRMAAARDRRGMTVMQLADRLAELGVPLNRVTLSKLENGLRNTVTPYELIVIAAALDMAPIDLIFGVGLQPQIELFPGAKVAPLAAVGWFNGDFALDAGPGSARVHPPHLGQESNVYLLQQHDELTDKMGTMRGSVERATADSAAEPHDPHYKAVQALAEENAAEWQKYLVPQLRRVREDMRQRGMILPPLPAYLDEEG